VIRRRHAHATFALLCASLVGALAWQAWQLHRAEQLTTKLGSVPTELSPEELASSGLDEPNPSIQLALGSALATGGNMADAEALLNKLISSTADQQIRTGAQYNLANLYLREALSGDDAISSRTRPMVELAKQRYRDLLTKMPGHWSARYNLERALRLAPEGTDKAGDDPIDPVKSVNVIVPGFEKKDLP